MDNSDSNEEVDLDGDTRIILHPIENPMLIKLVVQEISNYLDRKELLNARLISKTWATTTIPALRKFNIQLQIDNKEELIKYRDLFESGSSFGFPFTTLRFNSLLWIELDQLQSIQMQDFSQYITKLEVNEWLEHEDNIIDGLLMNLENLKNLHLDGDITFNFDNLPNNLTLNLKDCTLVLNEKSVSNTPVDITLYRVLFVMGYDELGNFVVPAVIEIDKLFNFSECKNIINITSYNSPKMTIDMSSVKLNPKLERISLEGLQLLSCDSNSLHLKFIRLQDCEIDSQLRGRNIEKLSLVRCTKINLWMSPSCLKQLEIVGGTLYSSLTYSSWNSLVHLTLEPNDKSINSILMESVLAGLGTNTPKLKSLRVRGYNYNNNRRILLDMSNLPSSLEYLTLISLDGLELRNEVSLQKLIMLSVDVNHLNLLFRHIHPSTAVISLREQEVVNCNLIVELILSNLNRLHNIYFKFPQNNVIVTDLFRSITTDPANRYHNFDSSYIGIPITANEFESLMSQDILL